MSRKISDYFQKETKKEDPGEFRENNNHKNGASGNLFATKKLSITLKDIKTEFPLLKLEYPANIKYEPELGIKPEIINNTKITKSNGVIPGPLQSSEKSFNMAKIHKKFTVHPEDLDLQDFKLSLEDIMSKRMRKYGDSDEDSEAVEENLKTKIKIDTKSPASGANKAVNPKFVKNCHKSLRRIQSDDTSTKINYSAADVKIEVEDQEIIPENSINLTKNIENDEERPLVLYLMEGIKHEPEKHLLIVLPQEKIDIKKKFKQDDQKSTKGPQASTKPSKISEASNKASKNLQTVDKFLKKSQNVAKVSKNKKNEAKHLKVVKKSSKEPKILSQEHLKTLSNFNKLGLNQYECKICGRIIATFNILKDHIRRHETKRPECDDCGKIFKASIIPKNHICEANRKFCSLCNQKFSFTVSYRLHMKNFHPELLKGFLFECDVCAETFYRKDKVRIHMEQKHLRNREEFICDFDGKRFKKRVYLFNHMEKHVAPTVECKICGAKMKEGSIYQHTTILHSKKTFSCKICPKTFKSLEYLKLHKKYHEKKFSCEICGKRFGINFEVNRHVRDFHENPRSYACKNCDKKFKTPYSLKCHLKMHMENRPKPFQCTKCSFKTDKQGNFKNHLNYHEKLDKKVAAMKNPIQCEICKHFCRSRAALGSHMRAVHPKNTFQCDHCGNVHKIKHNFLRHLKKAHGFYIPNFN